MSGGGAAPTINELKSLYDIDATGLSGRFWDAAADDAWDSIYGDVAVTAPAVVNLRFDDGYALDYTLAFPLLKARDLPFSLGLVSSFMDTGAWLTTAQALEMQQAGAELLCHSATHLTDPLTLADFVAETIGAQTALRALKFRCDGFIAPGTWDGTVVPGRLINTAAKADNADITPYLRQFACAAAYVTDDQLGSQGSARPIPVTRRYGHAGKAIDTLTLAQVQAQIDGIIQRGAAMQLYVHTNNINQSGKISTADFTAVLDYLVTKRDAGLLELMSFCGMSRAKPGTPRNYLGDGTFATAVTGTAGPIWEAQGAFVIDVGAGDGGGNALKANNATYLWKKIPAQNIRSFRVTSRIKNAVGGVAATARWGVWQYDSSQAQIGASFTRTKACTDAYTTWETVFSIRPDCDYFFVAPFASNANFVHYSNCVLRKI